MRARTSRTARRQRPGKRSAAASGRRGNGSFSIVTSSSPARTRTGLELNASGFAILAEAESTLGIHND